MLEEAPKGRRFEEDCNSNQFGIGRKEQPPSANPFLSPFMRGFWMDPKKDTDFLISWIVYDFDSLLSVVKKTNKTRFVTLIIVFLLLVLFV